MSFADDTRRRAKERNRRTREAELERRGNVCEWCGKKFLPGVALDWHHRDPATKNFSVGGRGGYYVGERALRAELDLCAAVHHDVCHSEAEQAGRAERALRPDCSALGCDGPCPVPADGSPE